MAFAGIASELGLMRNEVWLMYDENKNLKSDEQIRRDVAAYRGQVSQERLSFQQKSYDSISPLLSKPRTGNSWYVLVAIAVIIIYFINWK